LGESHDQPVSPVEIFSQPTGVGREGFGNSGRNLFRRPPVWNMDLSLFTSFQIGQVRPEVRIEAFNRPILDDLDLCHQPIRPN
jgi:hypothetical protein